MESRSYVATEISGWSAPIQRSHAPNPAIARRSGMCSRSYQSWNSSACAFEKSNAATSKPVAIGSLPEKTSFFASYRCLAPMVGPMGSVRSSSKFRPCLYGLPLWPASMACLYGMAPQGDLFYGLARPLEHTYGLNAAKTPLGAERGAPQSDHAERRGDRRWQFSSWKPTIARCLSPLASYRGFPVSLYRATWRRRSDRRQPRPRTFLPSCPRRSRSSRSRASPAPNDRPSVVTAEIGPAPNCNARSATAVTAVQASRLLQVVARQLEPRAIAPVCPC